MRGSRTSLKDPMRAGCLRRRRWVRDVPDVQVIDAHDPEMVLIEASEQGAEALKKRLGATHFVDVETRHGPQ
jgi:hypothetical protein